MTYLEIVKVENLRQRGAVRYALHTLLLLARHFDLDFRDGTRVHIAEATTQLSASSIKI